MPARMTDTAAISEPRHAALEHLRLEPLKGWASLNLWEVWNYRELLAFQAIRDIKVRYKQTILGAAWALIQPITQMVVFTLFFGWMLGVPCGDVPYPVFTFCALLPWQLFAFALTQSSNSLVDNGHLVTKVYFPRLILPLASVIAGLVDFCIAFAVLIGLMLCYRIVPTLAIVTLPFFILLALSAALSVGLWLSALNVQYRDIKYTIPFLTQILFFMTPIVYPATKVPEQYRWVYGANPMAGVVEGFRWALLGQPAPAASMLLMSVAVTLVLLAGGLFYFRRMEKCFADVV